MTDYFYKCLPEKTYQNGDYKLEAVQPEHIEKIRQWCNEQMDVLRQTKAISKEAQIQYYENNVWPEINTNHPDKILLSLKSDGELIGYGGLIYISWGNRIADVSFVLNTKIISDNEKYLKIFTIT